MDNSPPHDADDNNSPAMADDNNNDDDDNNNDDDDNDAIDVDADDDDAAPAAASTTADQTPPPKGSDSLNACEVLHKIFLPAGAQQPIPSPTTLYEMGRFLVLACEIVIKTTRFQIAEVEAYYTGPGHRDPFTHCATEQSKFGKWYFHRASDKPNAVFCGGTYKGLDISIGWEQEKAYGGFLIRSLRKLGCTATDTSNKRKKPGDDVTMANLVDGPCKCVDALLEAGGFGSIQELVKEKNYDSDISPANPSSLMRLVCSPAAVDAIGSKDVTKDKRIVRTPRIGLWLKSKGRCSEHSKIPANEVRDAKERFVMRRYRIMHATAAPHIKKGLHYTNIVLSNAVSGPPTPDKRSKSAQTALDDFVAGKKLKVATFWDANMNTTPKQCQMFGACVAAFGDV